MKVTFTFLVALLTLISCKAQEKTSTNTTTQNTVVSTSELTPQDNNYSGKITEEDFKSGNLKEWFTPGYEAYEPEEEIVEKINRNIDEYKIKVFMGIWCSDSRREIPKLYSLLDKIDYNQDQLEVIAVDRSKTTTQGYEKNYDIQFVPTIIFIDKNGKEINRFVEFPQETLEEDILNIVTDQPYKNSYAD
ncbi:thioredoxin-like protein [Mesonia algae]|uniref:Thioredoxin-like protein n=1 Tax=Mesonia algae TaxID=213248 RepID=A0A2W7IJM7_9FLAO|nr:thioredoxin family protein [Mesonia algae]PZW39557.1 thioredoxin-like protein [Mesonia algae]